MKERRSCSKVKPWIYFLMELVMFGILSWVVAKITTFYISPHYGLLSGLTVMAVLLYRTKAFQRLEFILERTEEVRKYKVREKYKEEI